jgi:hypothetical protein
VVQVIWFTTTVTSQNVVHPVAGSVTVARNTDGIDPHGLEHLHAVDGVSRVGDKRIVGVEGLVGLVDLLDCHDSLPL